MAKPLPPPSTIARRQFLAGTAGAAGLLVAAAVHPDHPERGRHGPGNDRRRGRARAARQPDRPAQPWTAAAGSRPGRQVPRRLAGAVAVGAGLAGQRPERRRRARQRADLARPRHGEQRPSEDGTPDRASTRNPMASTAPRAAAAPRGWRATVAGLRGDLRWVGVEESLSTWPTRPPRTRAGHRGPVAWPAPVAGSGQPLPGLRPAPGSRSTPSPAVAARRCGCCRRATGGGS